MLKDCKPLPIPKFQPATRNRTSVVKFGHGNRKACHRPDDADGVPSSQRLPHCTCMFFEDSNPDWRIDPDLDVSQISPEMLWIHFTEFHKNQAVTLWQMPIWKSPTIPDVVWQKCLPLLLVICNLISTLPFTLCFCNTFLISNKSCAAF